MLIVVLSIGAALLLLGPSRPEHVHAGGDSPSDIHGAEAQATPAPERAAQRSDGSGEYVVRARVVGPLGERVEGACVVGFGADPERRPWKAVHLPDGSFELHVDLPGSCWVTAVAPGWSGATPVELELGAGTEPHELELHLNGMVLVRGQARWRDGRPIGGARYVLSPQYSARQLDEPRLRALLFGELELGGRTAADGSFAIPGLAPGVVYTLELTPDVQRPDCSAALEDIEASQGPIELRVDPEELCGTTLRGSIRNASHEPAKSFRVQLWRQFGPGDWRKDNERTFQTSEGRFLLQGLREGSTYAMSIDTPDARWNWIAPFQVAPGVSAVEASARTQALLDGSPVIERDLVLPAGGALVIRVRRPEGPAPEGTLVLVRPDVVYPIEGQPTSPRADGACEMRRLAAGSYRVEVRLDDGTRVERSVDVRAGTEEALEIVLAR